MRNKTALCWILISLRGVNLSTSGYGGSKERGVTNSATIQNLSNLENSFISTVTSGLRFTDKSLFIEHIMMKQWPQVTYISRPSHFGKTFNKDMLAAFLRNDINSAALFKGLKVAKEEFKELRDRCMNKHPVVELDLSKTNGRTFQEAEAKFNSQITKALKPFKYLLKSKTSTKEEIDTFTRILANSATEIELAKALGTLCLMLYKHQVGNASGPDDWHLPIVLVDEPDTPLAAAIRNNYGDEMETKLRDVFHHLLIARRTTFDRAILFGVVPLFLSGKLSEVNVVTHSNIFQPLLFIATDFGLTEREVTQVLMAADMKPILSTEELKNLFNGHKIGDDILYTAKAVTSYVAKQGQTRYDFDGSGCQVELAVSILSDCGAMPALNLQRMMRGEILTESLTKDFDFQRVKNESINMWTYLTHTGFITTEGLTSYETLIDINITISNEVMKRWLSGTFQTLTKEGKLQDYDKFISAIKKKDIPTIDSCFGKYFKQAGGYVCPKDCKPNVKDLENYVKTIVSGWTNILERNFTSKGERQCVGFTFRVDNSTDYTAWVELTEKWFEHSWSDVSSRKLENATRSTFP